jgi:hypothetical protein
VTWFARAEAYHQTTSVARQEVQGHSPWRAFAYFSHERKVGRPEAKPPPSRRLAELVASKGLDADLIVPTWKDWNEDLLAERELSKNFELTAGYSM